MAARRAHNPKVVGSNPTPATILPRFPLDCFFRDDNSRSFGLIIESVESANGERDMPKGSFVPLVGHRRYSSDGMRVRSRDFNREMQRRRTVRDFSDQPVNR